MLRSHNFGSIRQKKTPPIAASRFSNRSSNIIHLFLLVIGTNEKYSGSVILNFLKMASKRRYMCVFNTDLATEFPFIKKNSRANKRNSNVHCEKCNSYFSIGNSGRKYIETHIESKKHQASVIAAESSHLVTSFFTSSYDFSIAGMEGAWAYHLIKSKSPTSA